MGVIIPQVITPSKASGAQVIDGSLKFDRSKNNFLYRVFSTAGNRRTWTWAGWLKPSPDGNYKRFWGVGGDTSPSVSQNYYRHNNTGTLTIGSDTDSTHKITSQNLRDTGWYHIVIIQDTNDATSADRLRLYVNGERVTSFSTNNNFSQNAQSTINNATADGNYHALGCTIANGALSSPTEPFDGAMSQVYFIDGQALEPENFGFTDPLTNTWKPKKYNVPKADTVLVGTPTYASSDFKTTGDKTSDQTGLTFSSWSGSYTGAETKLFKNSTDSAFTLNINLVGGTTDRYLWGSNNLTNWTYIANAGARYYQLSGYKYYATSEGSSSTALQAIAENGPNSFYLPMDGNSLIGKDQSGNGNDWTPVNFGGSVELDNPQVSGAKPILNTTQGGAQAGVGVFGSKENVGYAVTVYNDGGGNKYYIDGVKQDTVTGLIRGATYTFDTSDSTVSSHPFRFSATSNGSHGGGSEYTNGVAAITGAATTITVPHDAPNTLYYYCTSHSGMGADITGITTNEKLADQYASHCVLALPLVAGVGEAMGLDVSASIACTMTRKSVSSNGNAAASNSESNFYNGSFYFDGTDDTLTIPNNADFNFESGDYTIEMWVYPTRISGTQENLITRGTSGYSGFIMSVTNFLDTLNGSSWGVSITYDNPLVANAWQHIAVCRSGNTWTVYINGIANGSATASGSVQASAQTLTIGERSGQTDFQGYINDIRFYKGVAKYTNDFVVPSRSPDILPDTPSGVSGDSKLTKITDGALDIPDSNSRLSLADSDDAFNLGSGDWTIEAFVYLNNVDADNNVLFFQGYTSDYLSSQNRMIVSYITTGGNINVAQSTTGTDNYDEGYDHFILSKRWYHFAYVRNGSNLDVYVDGKKGTTRTARNLNNSSAAFCIGSSTDNVNGFDGFISNFRLVKGTAVYTKNFDPPTAPLTNITNTKLLCCQSNTGAGAAAVAPNVTSGTINSGTDWTQFVSGSTVGAADFGFFDGSIATSGYRARSGTGILFSPIEFGGISFSTSVEIYSNTGGTQQYVYNDGSTQTFAEDTWVTIASGSGTFNKLRITNTQNQWVYLSAIRVDGVILVAPIQRFSDAAATNFNPFNTDINTVRGQETGYATMNPLHKPTGASFSNGNLNVSNSTGWHSHTGTIGITTGKWYYEFQKTSGSYTGVGWRNDITYAGNPSHNANGGGMYLSHNGNKQSSAGSVSYGDTWNNNDIIGVTFDRGVGTIEFYKNGVSQGQAFTDMIGAGASTTFFPEVQIYQSGGTINFGQKPFKFSPPDGFQPLNAANVRPVKVISHPDQYVGIATWTGNSTDNRQINTGFRPDFVWTKRRDSALDHIMWDSVRGAGSELYSNQNYEAGLTSNKLGGFNDFGFTVKNNNAINQTGNWISWNWKAGGNKNTFNVDDVGHASAAAAGLTGGSITPTGASVGTKQGFSIIKYTGTGSAGTISHGLLETPDFILVKNLGVAQSWQMFHAGVGNGASMHLNTTDTPDISANYWNNTDPTSTVFSVGSSNSVNQSTKSMIAYCWHSVPGLQKFGVYEGTGVAGNYVHLGFRPALIWIKNVDSTSIQNWGIIDSTRSFANVGNHTLATNLDSAESAFGGGESVFGASNKIDLLSDGFTLRETSGFGNTSGITFLYCAWAEAPSIDLYGGGANAR